MAGSGKTINKKFIDKFSMYYDELKWLYIELYNNEFTFSRLCDNMEKAYSKRSADLKKLDKVREEDKQWYKSPDMVGTMIYADDFADTLSGVQKKLGFVQKLNINMLHLMPFLDSPKAASDNGKAVSNYKKIRSDLGKMEDLKSLAQACHRKNICICSDFIMNHTSSSHIWAKKAQNGEGEYMSRYFFYDNPDIPNSYDLTVPQVYPATAPGNFTYIPEIDHFVMTTFYPYEWDLNYSNPKVFNEMVNNLLFLANQGIDMFKLKDISYIWKEIGTNCRNLKQVHTIIRMLRIITEVVCPGVLLMGDAEGSLEDIVSYFGTEDKPECHLVIDKDASDTIWHTMATGNCKLIKRRLDKVNTVSKDNIFVNYLRSFDPIDWRLDYDILKEDEIDPAAHRKYLNDFFTGKITEGIAYGEIVNDDPIVMEDKLEGSVMALCGLKTVSASLDDSSIETAIRKIILLYAYLMMEAGIPWVHCADIKTDPKTNSIRGRLFNELCKLESLRQNERVFNFYADKWTLDTWDEGTLAMGRYFEGQKVIAVFNFTEYDRVAWVNENDGEYEDMITGQRMDASGINVPAYGFYLLKKEF